MLNLVNINSKKIFRNDVERTSLVSRYSKISELHKYVLLFTNKIYFVTSDKLQLLLSSLHKKLPFLRVLSSFTAKRPKRQILIKL